jgi:putative inorganic carbon (HCO3(-)) transporter
MTGLQGVASHNLIWPAVILVVGLAVALLPLTLAVAIVLGSIAFTVTLIRPEYGLYLLIFAVPWGSVREIRLGAVTVGVTEALVGLVLAAWLARMVAAREIKTVHAPLLLPLLIFLGAALLSLTVTLSLQYSLKEILKWLEVLGIYLFVVNVIGGREGKIIVILILLAGISQALLGIYQFFGRVGPEGFLLFDRFIRAYGTFEQPNPYGGYLGLVLPLAYSLSLGTRGYGTRARGQGTRDKVSLLFTSSYLLVALAMAGVVLMLAAMLMTLSRGAWLGFIAALIVMNVVRSRRAAALFALVLILLSLVIAMGGLQLLPEAITQRFLDFLPFLGGVDVHTIEVTPANFAVVERLAHWQAGWDMFSEHPWLGVGIGNYEPIYPAYALPRWDEPLGHAHNYYLNIAAEAGLVGLSAYLILWAAVFWQAWRAVRRTSGYWQGVAVGILGILTHLAVHNFFDNLYVHGMYVHIAILLGLIFVASSNQPIIKQDLLGADDNPPPFHRTIIRRELIH